MRAEAGMSRNTDFQDLAEHLHVNKNTRMEVDFTTKTQGKGSIHPAPTHMGYDLPLYLRAIKSIYTSKDATVLWKSGVCRMSRRFSASKFTGITFSPVRKERRLIYFRSCFLVREAGHQSLQQCLPFCC